MLERRVLVLNIENGRQSDVYKKSRAVNVCGFKWKLEVYEGEATALLDDDQDLIGFTSYLSARISCTVDDPQKSVLVKARCRLRVPHVTDDDLEKEWTSSLAFDPNEDDADKDSNSFEIAV